MRPKNLFDSIITIHTENDLWPQLQGTGAFSILSDLARNYRLFPSRSSSWIDHIARGTYPLHPFTTFALPWISDRVGQSNRTLFTFLSDGREQGLLRFTQDMELFESDGRRSYTATVLRSTLSKPSGPKTNTDPSRGGGMLL